MSGFGQLNLGTVGSGITVSADGSPEAKTAGVTIAWEAIAAFTQDVTFLEGDIVEAGEKFLRYGTVLVKVATGSAAGKYVPAGLPVVAGIADTFGPGAGNASSVNTAVFARNEAFILNRSVHEGDPVSDHAEVLTGGRVYKGRIRMVGSAADLTGVTAANMGTITAAVADVEKACPTLTYVAD